MDFSFSLISSTDIYVHFFPVADSMAASVPMFVNEAVADASPFNRRSTANAQEPQLTLLCGKKGFP